jgi:hypothetical protein
MNIRCITRSDVVPTVISTVLLAATTGIASGHQAEEEVRERPEAMPTGGLVGHWPLDGNALDTSGNGNHGTIVGAVPATGVKNGGYAFDGNAHIDLPNFTFSGAAYTVSIWVSTTNPVSVNDFRSMFDELDNSAGGPFELADGGNSLGQNIGPSYLVWNGGVTVVNLEQPTLNVRDGRWHMVSGTYKNGMQQLFIDGALMKSSSYPGPLPSTFGLAAIGGHNFGPYHHPWVGRLDEAVIYNRVLSKSEILKLYQSIDPTPKR